MIYSLKGIPETYQYYCLIKAALLLPKL